VTGKKLPKKKPVPTESTDSRNAVEGAVPLEEKQLFQSEDVRKTLIN
jgi:hypothetical protein